MWIGGSRLIFSFKTASSHSDYYLFVYILLMRICRAAVVVANIAPLRVT